MESEFTLKHRYWVEDDEGKIFFDTPERFLEFLQVNEPALCGYRLMSDIEFNKLSEDR